MVPDAFAIAGLTPQTGSVNVELNSCERSLNDNAVFGKVQWMKVYAFVSPTNESWTQTNIINYYLLGLAADNRLFVQASTNLSVTMEEATFTNDHFAAPDGSSLTHWTGAGPSWDLMADLPWLNNSETQTRTFEAHLWAGQGPFTRLHWTDNQTRTGFALSGGEVVFTGDGPLAKLLGPPASGGPGGIFATSGFYQFDGAWKT